jgi:hypothetical protein
MRRREFFGALGTVAGWRAAAYIDPILKGDKLAALPVQAPARRSTPARDIARLLARASAPDQSSPVSWPRGHSVAPGAAPSNWQPDRTFGTPDPRRAPQARHRRRTDECSQVHGAAEAPAVAGLEDLPAQSCRRDRRDGPFRGADNFIPAPVRPADVAPRSTPDPMAWGYRASDR